MDRLGDFDHYLRQAARDAWEAEQIEGDCQPCGHCGGPVGPQEDVEWLDDGGLIHLACFVAAHSKEVA